LKSILAQPKLAKKLKTLMECNIDFNVWEDNIVSLKVGGGPDNKITLQDLFFCDTKSSRTKMQVQQVSQKLLTLCSVLKERPYVQYLEGSAMAEMVASDLYKKLENLWSQIDEKRKNGLMSERSGAEGSNGEFYKTNRATVLVLDRLFDTQTPLSYDYSY